MAEGSSVAQHWVGSQHLCEERCIRFRSRVIMLGVQWPDMTSHRQPGPELSVYCLFCLLFILHVSRVGISSGSLMLGRHEMLLIICRKGLRGGRGVGVRSTQAKLHGELN